MLRSELTGRRWARMPVSTFSITGLSPVPEGLQINVRGEFESHFRRRETTARPGQLGIERSQIRNRPIGGLALIKSSCQLEVFDGWALNGLYSPPSNRTAPGWPDPIDSNGVRFW